MKNLSDNWLYIAIAVVTLLVVGGAIFSFSGESEPIEVTNEDLLKENTQVLGSRDSKVVIVEFSDFQCPACAAAHLIVKQVVDMYGDKILFAYRHFPIVTAHPHALKAAEAAEAAGEQGKFWEYHDLLFSNQENLSDEDLISYAKRLGLDLKKFEDALRSEKFKDKVTADMDGGGKIGIRATPTFFINGERHQGVIDLEKFKSLIDAELAK
jgi:protein-disulfide isomerase